MKKRHIIPKILLVFFTLVFGLVVLAFGACFVLLKGPSPRAKELFTLSCNETSAMKWVPGVFLEEEEVDALINPNPVEDAGEENGTYYIRINGEAMDISFVKSGELPMLSSINIDSNGNHSEALAEEEDDLMADSQDPNLPTYELVDIVEGTYKGKLLLVHDPSKVKVASIPSFGGVGWTLEHFLEEYNAIACINAGGFEDENGKGKGGIPEGIVIRDGSIVYGSAGSMYKDVVGFDADNRLHVGDMTGAAALEAGITNGMNFALGPVLIQDGVRQTGFTSGINPRSSIGQTADGTVILLAIEGRMVDSLGATFDDVADIMERFGAINAANLDGGSSSGLYYEGERVTRSCSVIGDRPLPTAIIVNR